MPRRYILIGNYESVAGLGMSRRLGELNLMQNERLQNSWTHTYELEVDSYVMSRNSL